VGRVHSSWGVVSSPFADGGCGPYVPFVGCDVGPSSPFVGCPAGPLSPFVGVGPGGLVVHSCAMVVGSSCCVSRPVGHGRDRVVVCSFVVVASCASLSTICRCRRWMSIDRVPRHRKLRGIVPRLENWCGGKV
jgi:hypothetical protein